MNAARDLLRWLEGRRQACGVAVHPMPFARSASWAFADGALRHRSGGFFSIVGIRAHGGPFASGEIAQPIIDQPEVGILGFIVRASRLGHEWLVQAKAEPGNVHAVQIAPTVQATVSNYMRLHGGAPTPYLDVFRDRQPGWELLADVAQSEHGSRFLGKYNRNVVALAPPRWSDTHSPSWHWWPAAALRAALLTDFAVNTDARSALVTGPWSHLSDEGRPFACCRADEGFGRALFASYARDGRDGAAAALARLERLRQAPRTKPEVCPVEALAGWSVRDDEIAPAAQASFRVRHFAVHAPEREVPAWDQPLLVGACDESVTLLCQRIEGVLHVMLRASSEIGFAEGMQFGPSLQSDGAPAPPAGLADLAERRGILRASTRQSDEGGRFMRCIARYSVRELPASVPPPEDPAAEWLTLASLEVLTRVPGALTNEARSALSLLLHWS